MDDFEARSLRLPRHLYAFGRGIGLGSRFVNRVGSGGIRSGRRVAPAARLGRLGAEKLVRAKDFERLELGFGVRFPGGRRIRFPLQYVFVSRQ